MSFMIPKLEDIEIELFNWAPKFLAEEWDNCGLQVGDPESKVKKILIALDASEETFIAALKEQADLVISHHPLIFTPIKSLNLTDSTTRLLAGFLRHDIGLISMHTNLDSVKGGVNDKLCKLIGLKETKPLLPNKTDPEQGLGRIGTLPNILTGATLLAHISTILSKNNLLYAGDKNKKIKKVAVCSGSGSTLFDIALESEADAFVTGEIKHSIALKARANNIFVIDAGHFHTEHPVVDDLAKYLQKIKGDKEWDVEISIFKHESSPLNLWIKD